MKLKIISFATMKQGHTYISEDLEHIYKVSKTYGGKNTNVETFDLDDNPSYPKYSYYKFNSETKVNGCNPKLNVFDLGTKPIYYRKDFDTLVHIKIDKVITDYLRFIHSIK